MDQSLWQRTRRLASDHKSQCSCGDYLVIKNYVAQNIDELSLIVGEHVLVLSKYNDSQGCWLGECNGTCGYFPPRCVTRAKPDHCTCRKSSTELEFAIRDMAQHGTKRHRRKRLFASDSEGLHMITNVQPDVEKALSASNSPQRSIMPSYEARKSRSFLRGLANLFLLRHRGNKIGRTEGLDQVANKSQEPEPNTPPRTMAQPCELRQARKPALSPLSCDLCSTMNICDFNRPKTRKQPRQFMDILLQKSFSTGCMASCSPHGVLPSAPTRTHGRQNMNLNANASKSASCLPQIGTRPKYMHSPHRTRYIPSPPPRPQTSTPQKARNYHQGFRSVRPHRIKYCKAHSPKHNRYLSPNWFVQETLDDAGLTHVSLVVEGTSPEVMLQKSDLLDTSFTTVTSVDETDIIPSAQSNGKNIEAKVQRHNPRSAKAFFGLKPKLPNPDVLQRNITNVSTTDNNITSTFSCTDWQSTFTSFDSTLPMKENSICSRLDRPSSIHSMVSLFEGTKPLSDAHRGLATDTSQISPCHRDKLACTPGVMGVSREEMSRQRTARELVFEKPVLPAASSEKSLSQGSSKESDAREKQHADVLGSMSLPPQEHERIHKEQHAGTVDNSTDRFAPVSGSLRLKRLSRGFSFRSRSLSAGNLTSADNLDVETSTAFRQCIGTGRYATTSSPPATFKGLIHYFESLGNEHSVLKVSAGCNTEKLAYASCPNIPEHSLVKGLSCCQFRGEISGDCLTGGDNLCTKLNSEMHCLGLHVSRSLTEIHSNLQTAELAPERLPERFPFRSRPYGLLGHDRSISIPSLNGHDCSISVSGLSFHQGSSTEGMEVTDLYSVCNTTKNGHRPSSSSVQVASHDSYDSTQFVNGASVGGDTDEGPSATCASLPLPSHDTYVTLAEDKAKGPSESVCPCKCNKCFSPEESKLAGLSHFLSAQPTVKALASLCEARDREAKSLHNGAQCDEHAVSVQSNLRPSLLRKVSSTFSEQCSERSVSAQNPAKHESLVGPGLPKTDDKLQCCSEEGSTLRPTYVSSAYKSPPVFVSVACLQVEAAPHQHNQMPHYHNAHDSESDSGVPGSDIDILGHIINHVHPIDQATPASLGQEEGLCTDSIETLEPPDQVSSYHSGRTEASRITNYDTNMETLEQAGQRASYLSESTDSSSIPLSPTMADSLAHIDAFPSSYRGAALGCSQSSINTRFPPDLQLLSVHENIYGIEWSRRCLREVILELGPTGSRPILSICCEDNGSGIQPHELCNNEGSGGGYCSEGSSHQGEGSFPATGGHGALDNASSLMSSGPTNSHHNSSYDQNLDHKTPNNDVSSNSELTFEHQHSNSRYSDATDMALEWDTTDMLLLKNDQSSIELEPNSCLFDSSADNSKLFLIASTHYDAEDVGIQFPTPDTSMNQTWNKSVDHSIYYSPFDTLDQANVDVSWKLADVGDKGRPNGDTLWKPPEHVAQGLTYSDDLHHMDTSTTIRRGCVGSLTSLNTNPTLCSTVLRRSTSNPSLSTFLESYDSHNEWHSVGTPPAEPCYPELSAEFLHECQLQLDKCLDNIKPHYLTSYCCDMNRECGPYHILELLASRLPIEQVQTLSEVLFLYSLRFQIQASSHENDIFILPICKVIMQSLTFSVHTTEMLQSTYYPKSMQWTVVEAVKLPKAKCGLCMQFVARSKINALLEVLSSTPRNTPPQMELAGGSLASVAFERDMFHSRVSLFFCGIIFTQDAFEEKGRSKCIGNVLHISGGCSLPMEKSVRYRDKDISRAMHSCTPNGAFSTCIHLKDPLLDQLCGKFIENVASVQICDTNSEKCGSLARTSRALCNVSLVQDDYSFACIFVAASYAAQANISFCRSLKFEPVEVCYRPAPLKQISLKHLEVRNGDSLDYHECITIMPSAVQLSVAHSQPENVFAMTLQQKEKVFNCTEDNRSLNWNISLETNQAYIAGCSYQLDTTSEPMSAGFVDYHFVSLDIFTMSSTVFSDTHCVDLMHGCIWEWAEPELEELCFLPKQSFEEECVGNLATKSVCMFLQSVQFSECDQSYAIVERPGRNYNMEETQTLAPALGYQHVAMETTTTIPSKQNQDQSLVPIVSLALGFHPKFVTKAHCTIWPKLASTILDVSLHHTMLASAEPVSPICALQSIESEIRPSIFNKNLPCAIQKHCFSDVKLFTDFSVTYSHNETIPQLGTPHEIAYNGDLHVACGHLDTSRASEMSCDRRFFDPLPRFKSGVTLVLYKSMKPVRQPQVKYVFASASRKHSASSITNYFNKELNCYPLDKVACSIARYDVGKLFQHAAVPLLTPCLESHSSLTFTERNLSSYVKLPVLFSGIKPTLQTPLHFCNQHPLKQFAFSCETVCIVDDIRLVARLPYQYHDSLICLERCAPKMTGEPLPSLVNWHTLAQCVVKHIPRHIPPEFASRYMYTLSVPEAKKTSARCYANSCLIVLPNSVLCAPNLSSYGTISYQYLEDAECTLLGHLDVSYPAITHCESHIACEVAHISVCPALSSTHLTKNSDFLHVISSLRSQKLLKQGSACRSHTVNEAHSSRTKRKNVFMGTNAISSNPEKHQGVLHKICVLSDQLSVADIHIVSSLEEYNTVKLQVHQHRVPEIVCRSNCNLVYGQVPNPAYLSDNVGVTQPLSHVPTQPSEDVCPSTSVPLHRKSTDLCSIRTHLASPIRKMDLKSIADGMVAHTPCTTCPSLTHILLVDLKPLIFKKAVCQLQSATSNMHLSHVNPTVQSFVMYYLLFTTEHFITVEGIQSTFHDIDFVCTFQIQRSGLITSPPVTLASFSSLTSISEHLTSEEAHIISECCPMLRYAKTKTMEPELCKMLHLSTETLVPPVTSRAVQFIYAENSNLLHPLRGCATSVFDFEVTWQDQNQEVQYWSITCFKDKSCVTKLVSSITPFVRHATRPQAILVRSDEWSNTPMDDVGSNELGSKSNECVVQLPSYLASIWENPEDSNCQSFPDFPNAGSAAAPMSPFDPMMSRHCHPPVSDVPYNCNEDHDSDNDAIDYGHLEDLVRSVTFSESGSYCSSHAHESPCYDSKMLSLETSKPPYINQVAPTEASAAWESIEDVPPLSQVAMLVEVVSSLGSRNLEKATTFCSKTALVELACQDDRLLLVPPEDKYKTEMEKSHNESADHDPLLSLLSGDAGEQEALTNCKKEALEKSHRNVACQTTNMQLLQYELSCAQNRRGQENLDEDGIGSICGDLHALTQEIHSLLIVPSAFHDDDSPLLSSFVQGPGDVPRASCHQQSPGASALRHSLSHIEEELKREMSQNVQQGQKFTSSSPIHEKRPSSLSSTKVANNASSSGAASYCAPKSALPSDSDIPDQNGSNSSSSSPCNESFVTAQEEGTNEVHYVERAVFNDDTCNDVTDISLDSLGDVCQSQVEPLSVPMNKGELFLDPLQDSQPSSFDHEDPSGTPRHSADATPIHDRLATAKGYSSPASTVVSGESNAATNHAVDKFDGPTKKASGPRFEVDPALNTSEEKADALSSCATDLPSAGYASHVHSVDKSPTSSNKGDDSNWSDIASESDIDSEGLSHVCSLPNAAQCSTSASISASESTCSSESVLLDDTRQDIIPPSSPHGTEEGSFSQRSDSDCPSQTSSEGELIVGEPPFEDPEVIGEDSDLAILDSPRINFSKPFKVPLSKAHSDNQTEDISSQLLSQKLDSCLSKVAISETQLSPIAEEVESAERVSPQASRCLFHPGSFAASRNKNCSKEKVCETPQVGSVGLQTSSSDSKNTGDVDRKLPACLSEPSTSYSKHEGSKRVNPDSPEVIAYGYHSRLMQEQRKRPVFEGLSYQSKKEKRKSIAFEIKASPKVVNSPSRIPTAKKSGFIG